MRTWKAKYIDLGFVYEKEQPTPDCHVLYTLLCVPHVV